MREAAEIRSPGRGQAERRSGAALGVSAEDQVATGSCASRAAEEIIEQDPDLAAVGDVVRSNKKHIIKATTELSQ
jgi:hypothetical protein